MNSTGARRFTAAFARFATAALCSCALAMALQCDAALSPQDKIARFKQLDSQAETAMQQHRPDEAVRLYQEAVCLVPNSARGYYGLGVAQAAASDFQSARESFRTSDRLQPTTGMPLAMQVRVNFSLGDIDALKANLREAAGRFPHDAQLHASLARFLAEHNLLVLAVAESMRSQQNPGDWNAQVQLAGLENTVGAYEDAVRNAVAVAQNSSAPRQVRGAAAGIAGLSYESLRDPEQAARYLKQAIESDPTQENSYLALADLLEQQQQYAAAVDVLQQARANIPDSGAVLLALGADLVRAERYKAGLELLQQVLRAAPDTLQAYLSVADAARKTGDTAQEIKALGELARRKPDYPMIHVLLARAMLNQQPPQYPKILDELSLAQKTEPNDPEIYLLQGKVFIALARYQQALPALQRSIELRPADPGPYYQLARVYQKLGKTEMANQQFARLKYLESAGVK